jgi:hypothetical protein
MAKSLFKSSNTKFFFSVLVKVEKFFRRLTALSFQVLLELDKRTRFFTVLQLFGVFGRGQLGAQGPRGAADVEARPRLRRRPPPRRSGNVGRNVASVNVDRRRYTLHLLSNLNRS